MRNIGLLLVLTAGLLSSAVFASTAEDQAVLQAKLEKKLGEEFVKGGEWLLDYGQAREQATREKKLLFVYFTRTFAA